MMPANLFVNRLYVLTDDNRVAYDERFHHGVNIIRGENSSGKSTITHLLFYALGGDYESFVVEARRCSRVYVEIETGGAIVTLSRPIEKNREGKVKSEQAMTIFWCPLDDALEQRGEPKTFGYRQTPNKDSFSNVLFRLLGFPIVQGDSNITMHQLLRLIYVDQESPSSSLFLHETWDNQLTRETVADLLMGIFDADLYDSQLRLREMEERLKDVKSEIRSAQKFLPSEQRSVSAIQRLVKSRQEDFQAIDDEIDAMRMGDIPPVSQKALSQIDAQKQELRRLRKACHEAETALADNQNNLEDTHYFLDELRRKQAALQQSVQTKSVLGRMTLDRCPECLHPLSPTATPGTCRLCGSPVEDRDANAQSKRIALEIAFQIKESEHILADHQKEKTRLKSHVLMLRQQLTAAQSLLDHLLRDVKSSYNQRLESLIFQKGVIKGEIEQYGAMLEVAKTYEMALEEKASLETDITKTKNFIDAATDQQRKNKYIVQQKIRQHGIYFLQKDLKREADFARASDFHVEFANNMVYLSEKYAKYSASSTFFLKLVARYALFFASLDLTQMRYPRFILADNMEDKGIEPQRAVQFQQTLIDRLKDYTPDTFQVIYTTSYITPALDRSPYVVGDHYDVNNKSLKNV